MVKIKKKLFIVKREVVASNIKKAITGHGKIFEITEIPISNMIDDENEKKIGFYKKNENTNITK